MAEEEQAEINAKEGVSDEKPADKSTMNVQFGNRMGMIQSISLILNAGLMLYAHLGLSATLVANQQRIGTAPGVTNTNTSVCSPADNLLWEGGRDVNKSIDSNFCARNHMFQDRAGCFLDFDCNADCFVKAHGFTPECAECFASIPQCSFDAGCTQFCIADGENVECEECSRPCNDVFYECSGLREPLRTGTSNTSSSLEDDRPSLVGLSNKEVCNAQQEGVDLKSTTQFFDSYEVLFFESIRVSWNNDARLVAVIIVLFSGIWPYAKNIILMLVWYMPMTAQGRLSALKWLRRLGKYTLVDVYAIIVILVGVQVRLTIAGDLPLIIKGESGGAILAFLFATLWEFVHLEAVTYYHGVRTNDIKAAQSASLVSGLGASGQTALKIVALLLSIGLLFAGALLELVQFRATAANDEIGCERSYNLFTLPNGITSDFFLHQNEARGGAWTLALGYFVLAVALPMLVHAIELITCLAGLKGKWIHSIADISWTFASVEVVLLSVFTIQNKFNELVGAFGGNEGKQFFGLESELGAGFYVLIGYCVMAGFARYLFNVSRDT